MKRSAGLKWVNTIGKRHSFYKQRLGVFSNRIKLKIIGNENIGGVERVKIVVTTMWLYWEERIPKLLVVVLFLKSSMQSF